MLGLNVRYPVPDPEDDLAGLHDLSEICWHCGTAHLPTPCPGGARCTCRCRSCGAPFRHKDDLDRVISELEEGWAEDKQQPGEWPVKKEPVFMQKISAVIARQREWVMEYMCRNSIGPNPRHYDTGTTYDCGADFCEAFAEHFPGRKPDPNLSRASRRLARLLRGMWDDGLVRRGIIGNEKYVPQEPSWQYVYSLYPVEHLARHNRLGAALLADGNAWYSEPQRQEMANSELEDGWAEARLDEWPVEKAARICPVFRYLTGRARW